MITSCPHCQTDLDLDAETLTAMGDATAFACPVCQGVVPNPALADESVIAPCMHCGGEFEVDASTLAALRNKVVFPCPICSQMLPASMFRATHDVVAATPAARRSQAVRGLNRNLLILGAAVLLTLGGLGFFLASRPTGDVVVTREDRVREIVNNRYFQDLIASGKADEKALLKSWVIRPYGTGFVGISGGTGTWSEAEVIARKVGGAVFQLDPPDAAAREAFLEWWPHGLDELDAETMWILDHGEPKVIAGFSLGRVSTMDRKRRVVLHWQNPNTTP